MRLIALIYKKFIDFRNWMYDKKKFSLYNSSIPIISVGNITVGGTGKTPFVIYLVRLLQKKGLNPLIISRGYKRKTKQQIIFNSNSKKSVDDVGDEPFLISLLCPNVDIVVNKNRVEAAMWAEKRSKYDVIILDDGYQHRSLNRDFNILLINNNQNLSDCIPYGQLREPLKNIKRSDCVVFTKSSSLERVPKIVASANIPIFKSKDFFQVSNVGHTIGVAFSGIGDPSSFKATLKKLSIQAVSVLVFSDHQEYNLETIKKIENMLQRYNQKTFFTTRKDWIKLPKPFIEKYNGICIDMKTVIEDLNFKNLLMKKINLD